LHTVARTAVKMTTVMRVNELRRRALSATRG